MLLRDEVYITQLDIYVRNTTKHAINIPNLYKVMYRIRLFVTEYLWCFNLQKRFPMGNYIIVGISPQCQGEYDDTLSKFLSMIKYICYFIYFHLFELDVRLQ